MKICVFAGSSPGNNPAFIAAAIELGNVIGQAGHELIYGGAKVGLMGAVADAALAQDSRVTGVLPEAIAAMEVAHDGLSELHICSSMHERKAMMAELGDVFICLPGGIGSMEELFEIWTWTQLGIHHKAVGLLDVADYYLPLVAFLDRQVEAGFVKPAHRQILAHHSDPVTLIDRLAAFSLPTSSKL